MILLHWDTIRPFTGHNGTEDKNRLCSIHCFDFIVEKGLSWGASVVVVFTDPIAMAL